MLPRKPLTAAELAAIYDREPTPTVRMLLHEIHRLRGIVTAAARIHSYSDGKAPHWMIAQFSLLLREEPCLNDPPTPRQRARMHPTDRKDAP